MQLITCPTRDPHSHCCIQQAMVDRESHQAPRRQWLREILPLLGSIDLRVSTVQESDGPSALGGDSDIFKIWSIAHNKFVAVKRIRVRSPLVDDSDNEASWVRAFSTIFMFVFSSLNFTVGSRKGVAALAWPPPPKCSSATWVLPRGPQGHSEFRFSMDGTRNSGKIYPASGKQIQWTRKM